MPGQPRTIPRPGTQLPHRSARFGLAASIAAGSAQYAWPGTGRSGRAAHDAVEDATDQAAARPWTRLSSVALAETADALMPLAQACAAALPDKTPVGTVQPTRP